MQLMHARLQQMPYVAGSHRSPMRAQQASGITNTPSPPFVTGLNSPSLRGGVDHRATNPRSTLFPHNQAAAAGSSFSAPNGLAGGQKTVAETTDAAAAARPMTVVMGQAIALNSATTVTPCGSVHLTSAHQSTTTPPDSDRMNTVDVTPRGDGNGNGINGMQHAPTPVTNNNDGTSIGLYPSSLSTRDGPRASVQEGMKRGPSGSSAPAGGGMVPPVPLRSQLRAPSVQATTTAHTTTVLPR